MRVFFYIVFFFFAVVLRANEIDNRTVAALEYINQGYIQYGYQELKKVATVNGLAAQYYLAVCYDHGIGVENNPFEAFKMYRKAAERGLPDAMYHLAMFYRDGIVVTKDVVREKEWLERFNKKGGVFLLPDILQLYNNGLKSPENYAMNPNNGNQPLMSQNNGNVAASTPTINNITIVQQSHPEDNRPQSVSKENQVDNSPMTTISISRDSDVDISIPVSNKSRPNVFVVIIANENYSEVAHVPYALNDGETFKQYCEQTLAIPSGNIKYVSDATLNNIKRQVNWLKGVLSAHNGEAKAIFYYAGHGIPDENNRSTYLLPTDGDGADITTGYALDVLFQELSSAPSKLVTVIMDACFSGSQRDQGMLTSARGVAIKAKPSAPKGNMVVFSAAQGIETAYTYREKSHGLFTYYLLKKLQESKGDVTLGDLSDYIIDNVKKKSIVINGKSQTPSTSASLQLNQTWRSLTF